MPRLVDCLLVGLGGFAGSIARFLAGVFLAAALTPSYPWGTLFVNLTGSFVAGVLLGMADGRGLATAARLLLVTGFLGGYTTFSAFSVETMRLAEHQGPLAAVANVLASVVGGLAVAGAGLVVGRGL